MVIVQTTQENVVTKVGTRKKVRRIVIDSRYTKIQIGRMGIRIGMCLPMSDKMQKILKVASLRICFLLSSIKLGVRQDFKRNKRKCLDPYTDYYILSGVDQVVGDPMGQISSHLNLRQ